MKCLIVAAGQGTRLDARGSPKPLVPLRGTALIDHVIGRARLAGITSFVVVVGFRGAELAGHLDALAARESLSIAHVNNDDWQRANGLSVLRAASLLNEPFLLTMCDHVVDPAIPRALVELPPSDDVVLAVDRRIADPLNDPDDVTRVKTTEDRIERIGKLLTDFDCFDTGVFRCTPAIFDALRQSGQDGDDSISGAMNALARGRRARVLDIGDRCWVDVDDAVAFAKAEALLDAGRL